MKKVNKLFLSLPLFGMLLTGCSGVGPSKSNYDDVGDEKPAPDPIIIEDEGKNDYIYYSDDYFRHESTRYNPHLATLSIYSAKYSMNPGGPDSPDDEHWYQHQSDRLANFWTKIGFNDADFNLDYYRRTSFDTIGIGCASRVVTEGSNKFTVIACTVRSGGYFLEWSNNVYLGDGSKSDMMHEGWYNAANKVIDFVGEYIRYLQNNSKLQTTQIKLWLSGFSRGGAVMNIAGGLLDNKLGMDDSKTRYEIYEGVNLKREDILVYTFEAPQGANFNSTTVAKPTDELYYNIFNIVNPNDFVTKVAMGRYGFTRFGIDKFIITEFFDPNAYEFDREYLVALGQDYDPNFNYDADYFATYGIDYMTLIQNEDKVAELIDWISLGGDFPDVITDDTTKTNWDSNIVTTLLLDRAIDGLGGRDSYCRNFQKFAVNIMSYMMNDCPSEQTLSWKQLLIMAGIQALAYVVIGPAAAIIDLDLATITQCTGAEVGFALTVLGDVFLEYPTEVISMISCISNVFNNHSTQLNVLHAQAQDTYYINRYNLYHSKNQIRRVPYRVNSEFVRFECKDINKADIWQDNSKGPHTVRVDQDPDQNEENNLSTIIYTCAGGYAVGIYSYATYHRLELFAPACYRLVFSFYDHSSAPWHEVMISKWFYGCNTDSYREFRYIVDEYYNCDSDSFTGDVQAHCSPESDVPSDLTNTSWRFKFTEFDKSALIDIDLDFYANGLKFHHLKTQFVQDGDDTLFQIFYDDEKHGEGRSPEYEIDWGIVGNWDGVNYLSGDACTSAHLIKFLFRNAIQKNT